MAHFSNSSEGEIFYEECMVCPLQKEDCPIAMAQIAFNSETVNNEAVKNILDILVKQDKDGRYIGCQMRPLLETC